jgi:dipeptidyl aminopeptidase/acylaminoacyl peptidase
MKRWGAGWLGCLLLVFLGLGLETVARAELPPLIPLRDFFRNAEESGHEISPDGQYLGFLRPWESRMNVFVQKIGEKEAVRITSVTDRDIPGFFWANDNRIVYLLDQGGDENFHLYAVNRDGSNLLDLTPFPETKAGVVDDLRDDPDHMLIQHNHRDKRAFDVFKVNVNTGAAEQLLQNPGNLTSFVADHEGHLRIATQTDGVNTSLLYRATDKDEFKTILTTNFRETVNPLFFTYDNRRLYAASNLKRDKDAIVVFDPEKAEEVEVIFEHPQVDASGLMRSDKRKMITGVAFTAAKRGYHFFDAERREIQEYLESKLPGIEVALAGSNLDEDKFLVRTYSDRSQGAYYFYDHKTKDLQHLTDISPWLPTENLARMEPVMYQSRDGVLIYGYLTLPVGVDPKNLPTVILPHGGPWSRDSWGFRPDVQFLANRGYAVFQMNFRGSTGFGRKFWEMSFKQWGRTMQDDVTDGVQWLIDRGIADPKRIGIYGGSYGGYVVLAGLAFTPDLYACGVDYVGVANLLTLLESLPPYWEPMRKMMYEMMGDPSTEKDAMMAVSPVFHVDKIKAPLLIAQGANDPRVKKAESDQMVEALRKRGIEVPYLVKDNEGHGFRNEENRFEVYRALEQFFAEHLGGRQEESAERVLEKLRTPSGGGEAK